jgi:hypothetical protein
VLLEVAARVPLGARLRGATPLRLRRGGGGVVYAVDNKLPDWVGEEVTTRHSWSPCLPHLQQLVAKRAE